MATLNATSVVLATGIQVYHSATTFSSTEFIAHEKATDDMVYVNSTTGATTTASTTNTTTRGMHYFPSTNELVMCNADTGTIQKLSLATTNGSLVQISSGANFQSLRGDRNNTYVFGWKRVSGVNQVYRMDPDGTNEITVDVSTLHQNEDLGGFALDEDNQRVFYHGRTTRLLYSISWDLVSNFTTYTLTVGASDNADIDYADGYVYYANIEPITDISNDKWYRFDPSTEVSTEIAGFTELTSGSGDFYSLDVFVDTKSNKLFISGAANFLMVTGTDFDFYELPVIQEAVYYDCVDISWSAVSGAIGYQVLVNSVLYETTTSVLTSSVRGFADTTVLLIEIQYTTDGTTYIASPEKDLSFTVVFQYGTTDLAPAWYARPGWGGVFLDPYNPTDFICSNQAGHFAYYNAEAETYEIKSVGGGNPFARSAIIRDFQTKELFFVPFSYNNRIINMGVNGEDSFLWTGNADVLAESVHQHSVLGVKIEQIALSFDGQTFYYCTNETLAKIYSVGRDGTGETLIHTMATTGDFLATDPLDSDIIVFTEGTEIKYLTLSTSIVTTIAVTGSAINRGLYVLGGVVYTSRYLSSGNGYVSINIDGSNEFTYLSSSRPNMVSLAMGLDTINKKAYVFEDGEVNIITDGTIGDLPSDPSVFSVVSRPISLDVAWQPVPGATAYGVRYSLGALGLNSQISSISSTTDLMHPIRNLLPGTEYSVYVYYSTSSANPSLLLGSNPFSTLPNIAANYDTSSYSDGDGGFDLSTLTTESLGSLSDLFNDLFSTGDSLSLSISGKTTKAKFISLGATSSIENEESVAIPFTTTGQTATLTLENATTVLVTYDDTLETIGISGGTYSSGDSFILDGKKATVYDV